MCSAAMCAIISHWYGFDTLEKIVNQYFWWTLKEPWMFYPELQNTIWFSDFSHMVTMSGRKSTRSAQPQLVNLVGPPEDLPLADLPTRRNVLQKMMQEKLNDPSLRYERHIPTMELAGKTGWAVLSLWTQMNTQMTRALVKEKEVVRRVFLLWAGHQGGPPSACGPGQGI